MRYQLSDEWDRQKPDYPDQPAQTNKPDNLTPEGIAAWLCEMREQVDHAGS